MKYTVETNEYTTYWYKEGTNILHRENGPAIEWTNGNKHWHVNGKLHREDGPAIESKNGDKSWYINDKLHREDGPAIECADGYKSWWNNGKCHREDGPAVELANGSKEYYINGKKLTEEQFNNRNKKSFTIDELKNMSLEKLHKLISGSTK
jgi:hypothetical protein